MGNPSNFRGGEWQPSAAIRYHADPSGRSTKTEELAPNARVEPTWPAVPSENLSGEVARESAHEYTIESDGTPQELDTQQTHVEVIEIGDPTIVSRRGFLGKSLLATVGLAGGSALAALVKLTAEMHAQTPNNPPVDDPTESPYEKPTAPERLKYPWHVLTTTFFGIGEHGSNTLAWEEGIDPDTGMPIAIALFGGIDDARHRTKDGLPKGFEPGHNPFYGGIPYDDYDKGRWLPEAWENSFWPREAQKLTPGKESVEKGKWFDVTYFPEDGGEPVVACGQWLDTGIKDTGKAAHEDYVFGDDSVEPKGKVLLKISHTMRHYLGIPKHVETARVLFRFINRQDVPENGPWWDYAEIDNKTYWY